MSAVAVHSYGDRDGVDLVVVVAVGKGTGFLDEVLVPAACDEADAPFFGEGYPGRAAEAKCQALRRVQRTRRRGRTV